MEEGKGDDREERWIVTKYRKKGMRKNERDVQMRMVKGTTKEGIGKNG